MLSQTRQWGCCLEADLLFFYMDVATMAGRSQFFRVFLTPKFSVQGSGICLAHDRGTLGAVVVFAREGF